MNPDTSVDVRFGPSAPKGHESNWVQTARTRVGAFSCACTAHCSRGSTKLGDLASLNWSSEAVNSQSSVSEIER